jgi:hypothetical protein
MFKIFGFGRAKPSAASAERQAPDSGATTRQHNDIQRELVRVVLKDTLRAHGIPGDWLTCAVTAMSGRARGEDILVRLVVLKWHEPLLKYMPALQRQLIAGLDRFEPSIDHSQYIFSWQFAPDCGCPHTHMPEAGAWSLADLPGSVPEAPVAAPSVVNWKPDWAAPVAPSPAKAKFDLPDQPAKAQQQAFASTEPSPLATAGAPAPAAKPKFDLPLSEKDAMPSTFAATEPGPLR